MNYDQTILFLHLMGVFALGMAFSTLISKQEKREDEKAYQEWKESTQKSDNELKIN